MIVMMVLMMVMTGLSGAGSRPGQAAGPQGEDHGGGDRDQEAGDGPLQVQVHHAQQRGQGLLHKDKSPSILLQGLNFQRAVSLYYNAFTIPTLIR